MLFTGFCLLGGLIKGDENKNGLKEIKQGWIEGDENTDGLKEIKQGWIEGDENTDGLKERRTKRMKEN